MTMRSVSLAALIDTRERLIADIKSRLDEQAQRFLLSLHDGDPDFTAISLPQAAELPAVRWKVLNLQKIIKENPTKHREQRCALEDVLG